MTVIDIWAYLLAAFGVGLGLGWWLWGGATPSNAGSAAAAKKRATPPGAPPVASPEADTLAELNGQILALRSALEQSEATREASELARSRAIQEARQEREVQKELRRQIDANTQARNTFNSAPPVVAAPDPQSASVSVRGAVPAPAFEPQTMEVVTRGLVRAQHTGVGTVGSVSVTTPDATPSASLHGSVPSRPPGTARPISPSGPRIVAPPPPKKRPRGPVDVLFGPLSGIPLTTSARSIPWELTIRVRDIEDRPERVTNLRVTLNFDLNDEGVAINGRRRGPLILHQGGTINPSRPLHIPVSLSTGFHSDTAEADRPPAVVGEHRIIIVVHYEADAPGRSRFSARIPVSSDD